MKPKLQQITGIPNLACKTKYKCITMGEKCPAGYSKDARSIIKVKTQDDIKKELAESMRKCWYQLGEGEYNFFDKPRDDTISCVICSVHYFTGDVKNKFPSVDNFEKYLSEKKPLGWNKTYSQYIYNNISLDPLSIDTRYPYSTTFHMAQEGVMTTNDTVLSLAGGVIGAGAGIGLGAGGAIAALALTPFTLGGSIAAYTVGAAAIIGGVAGGAAGGFGTNKALFILKVSPAGESALAFRPYTAEVLKSLKCEDIANIP